jgi:hypothetical protein
MVRFKLFLLVLSCAILAPIYTFAQDEFLKQHPVSTQAEEGFSPCTDTIKILKKDRYYDIGVILPSWLPIIGEDYVAVLEGKVAFDANDGGGGPHITHEDLPFYHYSHDVNYNVIPDPTPDNRFTNYLPLLVYTREDGQKDTAMRNNIHVEWESGLGASNRSNPLFDANNKGYSGGFFSAGHEPGDVIWNWPTIGDWVHVEGHYVWDRGHPPAKAEIHPARFVAIKRFLPEQANTASGQKLSTRVDIFASGDGGALQNNRYNSPPFVKRVNMSSKDYEFLVSNSLPKPSAGAVLKYVVQKRKGDTFGKEERIEQVNDSTIKIVVPWNSKNVNDLAVYARTVYLYWDEGNTTAKVDVYKVKLTGLKIKKLDEQLSKAEIRLFANVGSDWIMVNDFHGRKGKTLTKGLGKTRKKAWEFNNEFTVTVPRGKFFRVSMSGWEADGINLLMGDLMDQNCGCDKKAKRFFKTKIFSITNMVFKGCLDDEYGEISQIHKPADLGRYSQFSNSPQEGINEDPCPFSKYPLKDRYFLFYTIEKVGN